MSRAGLANRLAHQGDHGLRVESNDFLRVFGVQPTGYRATDGSTNRNEAALACRVIEPAPSRDHCRRRGNPAGARRRVRPRAEIPTRWRERRRPPGGEVALGEIPQNAWSAQNVWIDLSVAQILAKVGDSDSSGDAGCLARDLACCASKHRRYTLRSVGPSFFTLFARGVAGCIMNRSEGVSSRFSESGFFSRGLIQSSAIRAHTGWCAASRGGPGRPGSAAAFGELVAAGITEAVWMNFEGLQP